jgi:hypothetical protein
MGRRDGLGGVGDRGGARAHAQRWSADADADTDDGEWRIKASYAYVWDLLRHFDKYRQVGGSPSGFAWKIAMGDLGDIKARALHHGNAVCVPYDRLEKDPCINISEYIFL